MRFRVITSFVIFLGSYLPLSLILLAQNYDYDALSKPFCAAFLSAGCFIPLKNPGWAIGIFVACLACFALTLAALASVKPDKPIVIRSAVHVPADLMNYTLPYVVSFMSINYQDTGKFIGFLIFLAWMFWITHRSGRIIMNPVLIAFGWRPYELEYRFGGDDTEYTSHALVHGHVSPGETRLQMAIQDVLIIKP
jgi:hypothetical protein